MKGSPPVEENGCAVLRHREVGADGPRTSNRAAGFQRHRAGDGVAWSKDKIGHGTSDVIVRDAVRADRVRHRASYPWRRGDRRSVGAQRR